MMLRQADVADGRLEREQLLVAQLARPEVGGRLVEAALGHAVADHVLAGGEDARRPGRGPGGRGRRRSPARPRGTDPRRRSPRTGPSAGRGVMSRTGASAWRAPVGQHPRRMRRRHRARRGPDPRSRRRRSTAGSRRGRGPGGRAGTPRGRSPGCPAGSPRRGGAGSRWRPRPPRADAGWSSPASRRDLADAVPGERSRAAPGRAPSSPTTSNAQTEPSWASFSSSVIRAEQVGDAVLDRRGAASR